MHQNNILKFMIFCILITFLLAVDYSCKEKVHMNHSSEFQGTTTLQFTFFIVVPSCQVGFVNALAFSNDGNVLIAGIGQEHRLGRWWRLKNAKNSVCVIPLHRTVENGDHA